MSSLSVLILAIILIYLSYTPIYANTIDTTVAKQYDDDTITCNPNEPCTIICDEHEACIRSTINCPVGYPCDILCYSPDASNVNTCRQSTLNCQDSSECNLICQGDHSHSYSCMEMNINWPTNDNYTIQCKGGQSCFGLTIEPPSDDEDFYFDCSYGYGYSCFDANINCPTNANCYIDCAADYGCHSVDVNCPTNANSQCVITCDGLESCQQAEFFNNGYISSCNGEKACWQANFPQPLPDQDLILDCNMWGSCKDATLHCPDNADCIISCTNDGSCSDSTITWPTNDTVTKSLECSEVDACSNTPTPPSVVVTYLDTSDTTNNPTSASPTSANPTSSSPTTVSPTTTAPTSAYPTSSSPSSASPTSSSATTLSPTSRTPTTTEPTSIGTEQPTTATTRSPVEQPTISPTEPPATGIVINVAFNYTTTDDTDVEDVLYIILKELIIQSLNNTKNQNCGNTTINVQLSPNSMDASGQANINVTVPLCDETDVDTLVTYFVNELQTDIITESGDDGIILVATTEVEVDIKREELVTDITPSPIIITTEIKEPANAQGLDTQMIIILLIVIVCLLVVIVLLLLCLYRRKSIEPEPDKEMVRVTSTTAELSKPTFATVEQTTMSHDGNETITTNDRSTITTYISSSAASMNSNGNVFRSAQPGTITMFTTNQGYHDEPVVPGSDNELPDEPDGEQNTEEDEDLYSSNNDPITPDMPPQQAMTPQGQQLPAMDHV